MERHCSQALAIARFLEGNPKIRFVRYPFLPSHPQFAIAQQQMTAGGGVVSFDLVGGAPAATAFMNALKLFSITSNLGDTRSIASHPATTTHSKLSEEERLAIGITPGLIRLSIGLEHLSDIRQDLAQALQAC
jgi:O-succinylhomoserine sulfhydrylase